VCALDEYLGMGSFRDEVEVVSTESGKVVDVVFFELEKLIRLILKGHPGTLAWVSDSATEWLVELDWLHALPGQRSRGGGRIGPQEYATISRALSRTRQRLPNDLSQGSG
ncbi:MAG: hypothetical protein KC561_06110, partial [Myxococcales bacterium]|nr:hypothetical protein [Myxococcales bacterium]